MSLSLLLGFVLDTNLTREFSMNKQIRVGFVFRLKRPFNPIGLLSAIIASLLLFSFHIDSAQAMPGMINGTVNTFDGGDLPPDVRVILTSVGSETVVGRSSVSPDGSFSIGPVSKGRYILIAKPPAGSEYTQSQPKVVNVMNRPVDDVTLRLTKPQIRGVVVGPDGVTPAAAVVNLSVGDRQATQHIRAPDGRFHLGGLPKGRYKLQATPDGDQPFWNSDPLPLEIVDIASSQQATLTLQTASLHGVVLQPGDKPVVGAKVIAISRDGHKRSDVTNETGNWTLGNLPDGGYALSALPPIKHSHLIPSAPLDVMLPDAMNPYTLTLASPSKTVSGKVKTNVGDPVQHVVVMAHRADRRGQAEVMTDSDGSYQMNLTSGLWSLTVQMMTNTVPSEWVNPEAPRLVHFKFDDDPESKVEDFTVLTADATVKGRVEMPDGATPPFTVTVGLHNDEGIGLRVRVNPQDGSFEHRVANGGYKVSVRPLDRNYAGPQIDPIRVEPEGMTDLGIITLVAKDAEITGTVTDLNGDTVAGVLITAWSPDGNHGVKAKTGPDGIYSLFVSPGTWNVLPAPGPQLPYIYLGNSEKAIVESGQTVADVDFELSNADATISGILVDEAGNPLTDIDGWAHARHVKEPTIGQSGNRQNRVKNGAAIVDGTFTIQVPAGSYQVGARPAPANEYLASGSRQVDIEAGETVNIVLTMALKSNEIGGTLWDIRNESIVRDVKGHVSAWSGDNLAAANVNPDNGGYHLRVAPGVWKVNYRLHKHSDYVKVVGPRNVAITEQRTAVVPLPLPVLAKDALISGSVLAPEGTPLSGATVILKGLSGDVEGIVLKALSRRDGSFGIEAPNGTYRLGAASPDSGWIRPVEKEVEVGVSGLSIMHVLQFQEPTAVITGTLTISNATTDGFVIDRAVKVWAWSEEGGFTAGHFPVTKSDGTTVATGVYTLRIVSGTTWHVGANFETTDAFWRGVSHADIVTATSHLDVDLLGPHAKPGPVIVSFDAAESQTIELADGTNIYVPAGAMPVEGLVTLRVVPLANLPDQKKAKVIDYGYAIIANDEDGGTIAESFNQEVIISFTYDDTSLAEGVTEDRLQPAYFSTTTNEWTRPDSYTINTDENRISMQIDHFTDFAILTEVDGAVEDNGPDDTPDDTPYNAADSQIFLPLTIK